MQPSNITRYKGLGEQDAVELGDSALRPDSDRTLIRYTMESAKAEIEIMRAIDSNKAVLLKDIHITKDDIE
jgi:DNA gyrase/topoisomerase IV subunit B